MVCSTVKCFDPAPEAALAQQCGRRPVGVTHPQERCPVSMCQVATVVADAEESVLVERVTSAIRADLDLPALVMKTFVGSI